MTALANGKFLVPVGVVASSISYPALFAGALYTGGGHGSYSLWYGALVYACLAATLLLVGTIIAILKKRKKDAAIGITILVVSAFIAFYFWEISDWVADQIFK